MSINRHSVLFLLIFFAAFSLAGCDMVLGKKGYPDTDMYDLSKPSVIELPAALDEISGIAYYPKDTSLFAIIDEDGLLFKIPVKNPAATKEWRFDKKRDYEDIVLIESTFYVLVSNGDIETIRFEGNTIHTEKSDFSTHSKKENEFEAMYFNRDSGNLVIVCKQCEADSKKTFSSYSYSFRDSLKSYDPYMVMDALPVAKMLGLEKVHVKASAAAINPVTEDLYILSSINHVLITTSKKGKIKDIYKLDPAIYKQAEGIAFTPQGDMIISNEFGETGSAELLILKNKLKGR